MSNNASSLADIGTFTYGEGKLRIERKVKKNQISSETGDDVRGKIFVTLYKRQVLLPP